MTVPHCSALLSVPLSPHICYLHLVCLLPSAVYPRLLIQKEISQLFDCDHHFIFQFKNNSSSATEGGDFHSSKEDLAGWSAFTRFRCHCKVPLAWESINSLFKNKKQKKTGLKTLLVNRNHCGHSVRPALTTHLKEEKFNLKLNGLTYSLHL